MNQATPQQIRAAVAAVVAIIETVKEAGELGAPGGVIYSAMMAHSASLSQYEALMRIAVRSGKIEQRGQLYFAVRS